MDMKFIIAVQLNTFHCVDMKFLRVVSFKFFHFVDIKFFQSFLIKLFPFAYMMCYHIKEFRTLLFTDMKFMKVF